MILEMSTSEIDEFVHSPKSRSRRLSLNGRRTSCPVIYGWDAECIYVYTTEGKKVDMMP